MKKETLFILLGIGGVGAYLIFKNMKKNLAVSPTKASPPNPAIISTEPSVINPIANPIIGQEEKKPDLGLPDVIVERENKGIKGNVITDPKRIEDAQKEYEKALERERLRKLSEVVHSRPPEPPRPEPIPIPERKPVIDPMLDPIIKQRPLVLPIEKKPIRTSPTYTLPKYTDEDIINKGVDVEPFTKPAIPTPKDKIKSPSEIYTNARKMLQVEKGRINFEDKEEQDSYLSRANKSAKPRITIEQVPYKRPPEKRPSIEQVRFGMPERERELNFTYN